jgi:hypothetical protein
VVGALASGPGSCSGARGGESAMGVVGSVTGRADSVTAGELVAASTIIVHGEAWYSS